MHFREFMESEWKSFPRQRMFPFMHEPGYYRKGSSFLDKDEIDNEFQPDNIYHVTTNLQGVIGSGGLKSLAQLGYEATTGLGGRTSYDSHHLISATYQYDRALSIYHEFKHVLRIVNNKIKTSEILYQFLSDFPHNSFSDDWEGPVKEAIDDHLSKEIIQNEYEGMDKYLDKTILTGKAKYDFFKELETAFTSEESDENMDFFLPQVVIGFAARFENMKKINPNQLAILQLAVRKDAKISHFPKELEIRIRPKDVVVVRYLQPI